MTTITNAYSAANAVTAMQNRTTNTYGIKDTADNIEVNWNAIFGAGSPYSSVTVSDTNAPISISGTQYNAALKNNPNVMASNLKTMTSNTASANYAGLTVTGISDAKTLAAAVGDSHVTQIKVQMSVADIKKSLTTLTTSAKIAANGITATPTSPATTPQLDLTYAQFKALGGTDNGVIASTSALSKFSGFNFAITDATVAQAGSLTIGGISKISSVAIKDSGANIQAALTDTAAGASNKLTKLQALGTNLKSLTQTDTSKSIQLTYTQFGVADTGGAGSVMKKLATSSKLSIGNNTSALSSGDFTALISAVNANKNVLAAVTVDQGSVLSVAYDQYQQIKNGIKAKTSTGATDANNYKVVIVNPTKNSITNPPLTVAEAGALARDPNVASSKVALSAADFSSASNLNNTLSFLKNVNPDVNFTNYTNEAFSKGTLTIKNLAGDAVSLGTLTTDSAKSMADAINLLNTGGATGVTAKATATALNSGLISSTSTTAYGVGDLYINGQSIIDTTTLRDSLNNAKTAAARTALLISAINKDATKTATGVVATAVGATGYKLTAADGRNIDITSGRTSATGAASALGFDVHGANSSGVGGTTVKQYGNLSLSSTKEITIGGTGGGLKAGSYGTSFVGGEVALSYAQYQKLALNSNGTIPSTSPLAKATGVTFKITNATVDQALALTIKASGNSSAVSAVSIVDSAANIQAALTDATKLASLKALGGNLGSLSQSDPSKSIALTFTQFGAANGSSASSTPSVLSKLDNSSKLTLGSNASALIATDLTTALSAASAIQKTISNVTVAHGASLTLTQDQYQKLGSGLKATTTGGAAYTVNDFTVTISDKVSIASANSLLNDKKVASVVVGDDNADLADSSTLQDVIKLSANAKVQSIALGTTAESSSPMQLTYAQFTTKGGAVDGTITGSSDLSKLSNATALTSHSIGSGAHTYAVGDLYINGISILDKFNETPTPGTAGTLSTKATELNVAGKTGAQRTELLISAINNVMASNGVVATLVGTDQYKLTASDGRDITVTSLSATGAESALGFNVHGANNSGVGGTAVTAKKISFDITDASIDQAIGTTIPTTLIGLTVNNGSNSSKINSVSIKDTGANIKAALIDTTATTGKLAKLTAFGTRLDSVSQTDPTVPIAMTFSQFTAATNPVMAKLDPSTKLSFGDNTTPLTAANFATLLPSLEANKNTVGTITLTHNAAITLSYAQYQQLGSRISAQISAVSDKPTDLGISISSAISPEQASALLAGDSRITSVKVADAITHALGTQENLASTIALSNNSKVTMTLTDSLDASDVSQIANYGSQLSQLGNRVTAVQSTAAGLTRIINNSALPNVTSIVVSDSRANLISHISDISNATITSKLASTNPFAVTDLDTTTPIELSAANFKTDKTFSNASNAAYAQGSLFKINGSAITLVADGLSKVGGTASGTSSALSVATAINATNSGVLATASTAQDSGSIVYSSNTDYSADDLFINGINIIDSTLASSLNNATSAAARTTLLINAINTKSTATGVVATANGTIGYTLTAADGRNIDITSNRSSTSTTGAVSALGFAAFGAGTGGASAGVGGTAVTKYGSVRIVSAAPVGISGSGMGGDLVAGTYATKNPALLSALGTLKLTSVGAADAKTVATNTAVSQIAVNDSLSNVVANATNLAVSATLNKIQSITLTPNNPAISINNSDFSADLKSVLAKVSTSSYSIALKGLDLAAAGAYNFNYSPVTEHISSVSATETSAAIQAAFNTSKGALKTLGDRLASITITGDTNSTSTPNLVVTKSDFDTYHDLLSKVSGLKLSVTGVSAADATTVAGDVNINVVDMKVLDTAANIRTNFTALNSVALGGTVSATGTPTIVTAGKLSEIKSSNGNVNVSIAVTEGNNVVNQYGSGRSAVEILLKDSKLVVEGTVAETLAIITDDVAKRSFAAPASGYSISDALKINNVAIVATGASLLGDTTSSVAGTLDDGTAGTGKSAKAMAAAINAKTSTAKVTATATTAVDSGVITYTGETDYTVAGGDLYINKQQIIDATLAVALNSTLTATGRTTLLINAINAKSSASGVTAARIGTTNSYSLNAADGRNIDITSNRSSSAVSGTGFAVSAAAAGVGGTAVTKYGSLTLTSTVLASAATDAVPASITVSGATAATNGLADGTWSADALVDAGVLVSVTDTASNIKDNLSALLSKDAKVTGIAVSSSDTNKVTISSAQFFTDYAALMPKIAGGVVVTGVKADDTTSSGTAAKLDGSTVRSFTVTDSASEITQNLARLSSYATGSSAKLTAINETDDVPAKITVGTLSAVSQYKDALKLVKDINNQNAGLTITDMST